MGYICIKRDQTNTKNTKKQPFRYSLECTKQTQLHHLCTDGIAGYCIKADHYYDSVVQKQITAALMKNEHMKNFPLFHTVQLG